MSPQQSSQKQLEIAQAQIQQLSQQLMAEREAAQLTQSQLQEQLDQQQQRLADLEAKEITYRQQFDCNPQPMWIFDLETLRFLKVNDAAIAKYGYSRDEFLSMTIADIRPPEDVPRLLAQVPQVGAGLSLAGIWRHCLRDGQIIYVEINSYVLEFEGRQAKLVTAQDVSDLRQAQLDLETLNQELEQKVSERTAALATSEDRLNLFLNANPAILYSCEPYGDYACTFVSKNVEALLGYTPEEFCSTSDFWMQRLHPDDVARVLAGIPDLFEHGIHKHEYRLRHRDGHYIWVYDELTLLRDEAGNLREVMGFLKNISDHKQAESQIKQLLSTIETAIDGIGITQNNIFIYANHAQLDMFGYSADELIGQPWTILYSADEIARLEQEVVPTFMHDRSWLGETIATRKDGTTFNQELSLTLGEDGLTIGVSKNISERKQAEIKLQNLSERLTLALAAGGYGIWEWDLNNELLWDDQMYAIFGLQKLGKSANYEDWRVLVHPDDIDAVESQVVPALTGTAPFDSEFRITRPDAELRWIKAFAHVIRDDQGKPIRMVGINYDISDRKQAEIALQKSEELYRQLFNSIDEGFCTIELLFDDAGNPYDQYILQANPRYAAHCGIYNPVGKTVKELMPEVEDFWHQLHAQVLATGIPIRREIWSDVFQRWFAVLISPIGDTSSHQLSILFSDITDRKRQELALTAYTKRVEDLYNNAPCGYCSLDIDNCITQINNTALIWLAYLREEILGKPITEFMNAASQRTFVERYDLLKQADLKTSLHYEIVLIGSHGGQMTFLFSDEAQQDAEGNILGCRITITDIRHRVKAEKLLQQQLTQANLLRQITTRIRQSLDLSTIFNTTCNELQQALHADRVAIFQFYPTSNFNGGEFIAESLSNYPSVLGIPIHDHCFSENFANLYTQGKYHAITNIRETNLSACYADILRQLQIWANLIVPLLDRNNTLWGMLCVHQCDQPRSWYPSEIDLVQHLANQLAIAINQAKLFEKLQQELGDRQLAEQELEERNQQLSVTNAELERATRLKDEFLANMSHELRTPLNAILGMTESMQEEVFGIVNERQLKALHTIEKSGTHLLTLINDILDLAKIAAGEMKLECSSVAVEQLCSSAVTFIKQQAHKKQIRLNIEILPNLPNLYVDEVRIRQVLLNLLTNAVKFTPEGGSVTITASLIPPEPDTNQPTYLRFAITDTGIGISSENISRLFQPFIQIDSALNRKQMGTGLGLALVKQMVELHGGQVRLTSEFGVGSCFTVDLPYRPEVSTPRQSIQPQAIASDIPLSQLFSPTPTSSYLILLAEDNPANVVTISNYLEAKGYRMIFADNGQEAIDLARSHQPDLILMDIQMPELDGFEAIKQIRHQESLRQTPIIALTALTMKGDRDRCLAAGANDYLSKPVKLKHLQTLIQEFLN